MGFYDNHSSSVSKIQNLTTGYISPYYHIVFDDLFQKFCGTGEDEVVTDSICNQLSEHNRDFYIEEDFGQDDKWIYYPLNLDDVCLDEPEQCSQK